GDVIGAGAVRIKSVPVLGGLAYISGGPLCRKGGDSDEQGVRTCLSAMIREYVERRGLTLRVLAPIGCAQWNAIVSTACEELGMAPAPAGRRYRTLLVNIDREPAALRASFASNWRNHLKGAERAALTIETSSTEGAMTEFCAVYDEFVARKGFDV